MRYIQYQALRFLLREENEKKLSYSNKYPIVSCRKHL